MSNIALAEYNPALDYSQYRVFTLPYKTSRVAQWKRAGPINQRSVDRNHALLKKMFLSTKIFIGNMGNCDVIR